MTIPFSTPNNRMFYACVGVLVGPELVGRNDIDQMSDATDHKYLTGVTSVGVNGDMPSTSLMDVGRFQRKPLLFVQTYYLHSFTKLKNRGRIAQC